MSYVPGEEVHITVWYESGGKRRIKGFDSVEAFNAWERENVYDVDINLIEGLPEGAPGPFPEIVEMFGFDKD